MLAIALFKSLFAKQRAEELTVSTSMLTSHSILKDAWLTTQYDMRNMYLLFGMKLK